MKTSGLASLVERIGAGFDRFTIGLGSISAVATLCIVALISVDIVARNLFSTSIHGAAEVNILLLVMLVYLGLAGAQAKGEHFSVTFLAHLMPPRPRWWMELLALCLLFAIVGYLAYLTYGSTRTSVLRGEASWGIVTVPIWPARIAVTFGLSLLALQILMDLLRHICGADRRRPVSPTE